MLNCVIAAYLTIIASDPCWTQERYQSQFADAQARIELAYWLMTCDTGCPVVVPYRPRRIESLPVTIIERSGPWQYGNVKVVGLYTPALQVIEYSRPEEHAYGIFNHEAGHMLKHAELPWDVNGWSNHGHGTVFDLLYQSLEWLYRWLWVLPPGHSYRPWLESVDGHNAFNIVTDDQGRMACVIPK